MAIDPLFVKIVWFIEPSVISVSFINHLTATIERPDVAQTKLYSPPEKIGAPSTTGFPFTINFVDGLSKTEEHLPFR